MLPEEQIIDINKNERQLLDDFKTVRVRYYKKGNLQFISHLDMQRTWQRVLVRAGIPMWYTKGFNPHAKVTYGCPMPVGTQSVCECVDIRIEREISCGEIKARLNRELTDEMRVYDVYFAQNNLDDIDAADYTIKISGCGDTDALAGRINTLFHGAPVMMLKHSKAGDREVDILPYIKALEAAPDGNDVAIHTVLAAGNRQNLNAEMLVGAMKRELGILGGDDISEDYEIMRNRLLNADGSEFI